MRFARERHNLKSDNTKLTCFGALKRALGGERYIDENPREWFYSQVQMIRGGNARGVGAGGWAVDAGMACSGSYEAE